MVGDWREPYPLERCARIAASVARRREDETETLRFHELDAERWRALERETAETLRAAVARGDASVLRGYDDAYLAQLERERGPVTVEDYARVTVAAERGNEREVLVALGLPRGVLLRLQRVWLRKVIDDQELAARVRRAIEAARAPAA